MSMGFYSAYILGLVISGSLFIDMAVKLIDYIRTAVLDDLSGDKMIKSIGLRLKNCFPVCGQTKVFEELEEILFRRYRSIDNCGADESSVREDTDDKLKLGIIYFSLKGDPRLPPPVREFRLILIHCQCTVLGVTESARQRILQRWPTTTKTAKE